LTDPFTGVDVDAWERLALRAAQGEEAAWEELFAAMWPVLRALVQADRSTGPMRGSEDELRELALRVVEKVGGARGRGLGRFRSWRDRHPGKTLADWLRIVAKNAVRDRVRERLGPKDSAEGDAGPSVKRLLNEFASSPALDTLGGKRHPMTLAQTARELLEFARARLPEDGYRALVLWTDGAGYDEIQGELGLEGVDQARRLVRAAVAVLRRQFGSGAPGGESIS
jgi:hypothetical protein